MSRAVGCALAGLALALVVLAAAPAAAQSLFPGSAAARQDAQQATPPELSSPEAVREMVARLSDAEVRALLLARLDAEVAEQSEAGDLELLATAMIGAAEGLEASFDGAFRNRANLIAGWGEALGRFHAPRGAEGTARLLGVLALALALGLLAQHLAGRLLSRVERRMRPPPPVPGAAPAGGTPDAAREPPEDDASGETHDTAPALPPERPVESLGALLGRLLGRLGLEALRAAALLLAFWLTIRLALTPEPPEPRPSDYLVLWFLLKGPVLYATVMAALSRFLLAPRRPEHRLMVMDDASARFLHRSLIVFAAIAGMHGYLLSFLGGHGVDLASLRFGFWTTLLLYGWLLGVVWVARRGLTDMLIGEIGEPTVTERRVAEAYPWIVMVLIVLFWTLTEVFTGLGRFDLLDGRLPLTLILIVFAPAADRAVRALVHRRGAAPEDRGAMAAEAFAAAQRSRIRVGRILIAFLFAFLVTRIWNIRLIDLSAAGIGAQFAGRMLEAAIVLGVGYVLVELLRIRINGAIARERTANGPAPGDGGGEGGGAGGSRLATVLPLVSWSAQAAIVTITCLTALSTLGVDTTPLLAGAGIAGIAIGFGAQKLVADIVSGLFFLIDDAFRTGEYVEIEGTRGTVEKISLRSLRLRHHTGPVHTIPFGEIRQLTNYSRDWVIMKLRFTVPFETDLKKVKKIFKTIGQEMMQVPEFAADFLEPFKSQGVLEVDDVGLVIRGKFMAKPGRQWVLRKEIYQRVQEAFDANGIEFARKEVRVRFNEPGGEGGAEHDEEHRRAAAAAALEAAGEIPARPG